MMSAYSEDLRRRIVTSVEGGMPKAQAARTFSVSLSSVKRYANKAERGQSLAPKKRPGSAPKLDEKAMKLLRKDLAERPFATLRERCEYVGFTTGRFDGADLRIRTQGRAIAAFGAEKARQEHHAALEHDPPWDGAVFGGGGGYDRRGVRSLRREGAVS
jgi:transposase